jgi:phosphatidylinositol alpha-1,6-mannosyltransferase
VALLERLPGGRALARYLASGGAELVFVTEVLRQRFARLVGRVCGVTETLAVPGHLFAPRSGPDPEARRRLGVGGPTVLAVGRLVPIKGFDLLVRACAAQGADPAPIDLVLLGEGPERDELRRLARALGVSLRLPGTVSRAEVAAWLGAADVYAQPSRVLDTGRTEGLPVATLEALQVGVPAVLSDSGGLAELASRARLFAAGDLAGLKMALRALLFEVSQL